MYKFIKHKFKAMLTDLRDICPYCKKPNTGRAWCNRCDPGRFLREGKTSGNPEMDKFIYKIQLQTEQYVSNLEWISYDRLQDIKLIGEGGFANIYSATWLDGKPIYNVYNRWKERSDPITVALKKLKNSKNMTEAFINEIKIHYECYQYDPDFTNFYGITKDPQTEEFIMVLEYAKEGNLRTYLKNNFSNLKWEEKLNILYEIALNLRTIHDKKYIHKDLHSGNILQFKFDTKITDLGLAQIIKKSSCHESSNVCGVLPYIAPEVLIGKPYTFASDVYSLGIIMIEVANGKPPYFDVPHDEKLALAICNGLRPRVNKGTPQCYIDLVNQCLDANPEKRPSTGELCEVIRDWQYDSKYHKNLAKEFINADEIISQESFSEMTINPKAIYTSHLMSFTNLSKPKNTIRVQIEDSEVLDSKLIDIHAFDKFRTQDLIRIMDTNSYTDDSRYSVLQL